jgi:hypothetical protein
MMTILSPFESSRVVIVGIFRVGGAPSAGGFVRSIGAGAGATATGAGAGGGVVTTRGPEQATTLPATQMAAMRPEVKVRVA